MIGRLSAALFGLLLFVGQALAQNVQQSGPVTSQHLPYWVTSGAIGDGGSSLDSPISSIGVTNEGGAGICVASQRQTAAGRNLLCLSAATAGPATISLQNSGTATPQNLEFIINGTAVQIPTGGNTFIFGNPPFTTGDVPCFVNTNGVLQDCGLALASGVVTSGTWQATPIGITYGGSGATTAAAARTNFGLGTIATQNSNAISVTGGTITGMPTPTNPSDVAVKSYVDSTATGLNILAQSRLATAAVLPNSPTYSNGSSGVGATLTAGSNTTLTVDGTTANLNDVVLVRNQASAFQNGIYTVTQAGSGSAPWILTRATYFNVAAQMTKGSYTFITAGSTNINTSWTLQSTVVTVGTDALNFVQFSSGSSGSVTSIATGPGLTGGPITTSGTIAIDYTATNAWTGANSYSAPTSFVGNAQFGGVPWFDVKSTAQGCAAAAGNNSTDDTTAIQCHINYLNTTYGGGTVYFPPGNYLVSGGGLIVKQSIWLVGNSIDSTSIQVHTDSIVLNFFSSGGNCPSGGLNAGIDKLSIYGYQNVATTQPAVAVGANCVANFYNSRIWFGTYGLSTAGSDGTIFNSFICGYVGCVNSIGANWYERAKLDSISAGIPSTFGFVQGVNAPGLTIAENHLIQTDLSCSCAHSLYIDDGSNNSITSVINGVLDSPIFINHARFVQIVSDEVGSTSFAVNNGTLMMSSTAALATTTISGGGGKVCAGNVGFTNC
jgi:hypothetical protein